jgi:hypothetical protein
MCNNEDLCPSSGDINRLTMILNQQCPILDEKKSVESDFGNEKDKLNDTLVNKVEYLVSTVNVGVNILF